MKIPFIEDRGELLRWALSGATVVFLHGAVTAAMINWSDDDASEPTAAMVVDLAPFPIAPPESVTDLPPGPAQVEAEASPQTPVTEVKEQVEERPETAQSQELQPELAPAVNPEVALDTSPPKPEQKIELQQENQLPAPETTAPPEMPAGRDRRSRRGAGAGTADGRPLERDPDLAQLGGRAAGTQQALSGRRQERPRHCADRIQHRPQGPRDVEPHRHHLRLAGARSRSAGDDQAVAAVPAAAGRRCRARKSA